MSTTKIDASYSRPGYGKIKKQLFACVIGNLIMVGQGFSIGWLSPSLPFLQSENSPLSSGSVNYDEASWIGSVISIGAITGSFLFGIMSNYVGSKTVLLWCSIPVMVHWILIKFSTSVWQLCVARILTGMTGGGIFACIPLFIAEIANNHVRGSLASMMTINYNIGTLLGLILGSITDYSTFPLVAMIFPIIFFCLFLQFPSTPQYLLKCGRVKEAEKSLKYYRNYNPQSEEDRDNFLIEFNKFKEIAQYNKEAEGLKVSDFCKPAALKGMIIGFTLMFVSCCSGSFTLINYAAIVFQESGSNVNPNTSAIVLGVIQTIGTLCTVAVIDRFGRKILMLVSTTGVALCLSVMGVYSYLAKHGHDLSDYNLVPVVSLSLVIYMSAVGLTPVPYVLVAEILPQKVRRAGAAINITSFNIFAFLLLKIFPLLLNVIELYGCMAVFASTALFGLIFTIFFVTETKGKNLDTLEQVECEK